MRPAIWFGAGLALAAATYAPALRRSPVMERKMLIGTRERAELAAAT